MAETPPEPDSPRDIVIAADGWTLAPFGAEDAETVVEAAVAAAVAELGLVDGHGLAILLSDDAGVRLPNRDHRGKDAATNVLSFPAYPPGALPEAGHIGDIAVALETVLAEAEAAGKRPRDHLAHMIVHGLAHLAGLDHADDAEADIMEALEVRALARIGVADPYKNEAPS